MFIILLVTFNSWHPVFVQIKEIFLTKISDPECIQDNVHYDGFRYRDQNTDSAEECACACKHEDRCSFFTWTKNERMCHMKTSIGKQERKYGSFSGSVNCCKKDFHGGTAECNFKMFSANFFH